MVERALNYPDVTYMMHFSVPCNGDVAGAGMFIPFVHAADKRIKGHTGHDLRAEFPFINKRIPTLWAKCVNLNTSASCTQGLREPKQRQLSETIAT